MICNYGNQTKEILFPIKSLCSEEFGGKLLEVGYTTGDYLLIFLGCVIAIIFVLALVFVNEEVSE